jgi:hypothetical protein
MVLSVEKFYKMRYLSYKIFCAHQICETISIRRSGSRYYTKLEFDVKAYWS